MAKEQIAIFKNTITEQLLGPGSDTELRMLSEVLANNNHHEVITDFPLKRYYTGILFPNKILKDQEEYDTQIPDDSQVNDNAQDEEEVLDVKDNESVKKDIKDDDKEVISLSNHFHPSDMGISFCVDKSVKTLAIRFSFATYSEAKQTDISVAMSPNAYTTLIDEKYGFPFKDIVNYKKIDEQNGFLSLNKALLGKKKERSDEYKQFDGWRKDINPDFRETLRPLHQKFNKLIARLWQRTPISIIANINLEEAINKPRHLSNFNTAGYTLKTYTEHNRKYIKIQLVNLFPAVQSNQFSNSTEALNSSCLFQAQISVESDNLKSYKPYNPDKKYADKEQEQLDFLYRKVAHFSIGHNCSAGWQPLDEPNKAHTTFLPTYDLKDTKSDIDGAEDIPLYDLSIWGHDQTTITNRLNKFIAQYARWIDQQKQTSDAKKKVGKSIIRNLDETLKRLEQGVRLLQENDKLFKAFQYANTAMLLQFLLAGDFYKKVQQTDLKQQTESLFEKQEKNPVYRPFQLAFLLLSLDSIIDPQSKHRKDFVDLIWFPTGGGKTEAYLAVAALSIIWRRMTNKKYQGVSVIMRYTLRLLTAQQFERASKLIIVLDYLRQQFPDELGGKSISIGLWIGQASTPNDLIDAKKVADNISSKGKEANKFQIDTCPWCSSELIQKKNSRHPHAFEVRSKGHDLKIKCLNRECYFSNGVGLPVQVVDEVLYNHPPTLLFATVDKMAMLSWREEGHVFFNSLGNEKNLPPDLIIQDELHLLTGPLGSLIGLFESVIESLCTKDNHTPKIIASTATTRNTHEQVKQLYGNRAVNIFPPPGLTYDDSFFFKQDANSNRKYLGFMPTGKTGIDSQIHLLTTLFIARLKIYLADEQQIDPYWTLVSYYNSLKDVGRMSNKVGDEIQTLIGQVQKRLRLENSFNYYGLKGRTRELTSRVDGASIKQNLSQLDNCFALSEQNSAGYHNIEKGVVDLVLATNMLSAGIDLERLNMMLINGMPRNVAEYIQASSRIGRKHEGLVVSFSDSNRARDKSYFEHFLSFHQSLYKQIEPLSITPFTENTIDKMIASVMVCYVRHKKQHNKNVDIKDFTKDDIKGLKVLLKNRFPNSENIDSCNKRLDNLADDWWNKINQETPYNKYSGKTSALLDKPDRKDRLSDGKWVVMQSMRDIDSSSFIQIQLD